MFSIVNIMKAMACLLIANFHSDITFPDNLSILAFGGDLGNNIFFLISGFTIWPSVSRTVRGEAFQWYKKRFIRIIPMVGLFYFAEWIAGNIVISSLREVFRVFVFPTLYWFTGAILIMYVVYYITEKYVSSKMMRTGIAVALLIVHLVYDTIEAERYLIGFLAMMVGCELRRELNQIVDKPKMNGCLMCAAMLVGVFCALKILRAKGIEYLGIVHLSIGLLTIMIGAMILVWGIRNDQLLTDFFTKNKKLWKLIVMLSNITMAVYLTMGFGDRILMKAIISVLPFPLSYVIGMVIYFAIAYVITQLDQGLQRKLK